MRQALAIFVCTFCAVPSVFAQPIVFPDNTTSDQAGGLMIIRKGGQTTWSLGGAFLPRSVKVVNRTPEGKEITRFKMPSVFQNPYAPPLSEVISLDGRPVPSTIQVELPDQHALLFVDGEPIRTQGTSRSLESPPLPKGKSYPLRIRAAYVVGDRFVIEDREISVRAGDTTQVSFDGSRAVANVPLRKDDSRIGQAPPAK